MKNEICDCGTQCMSSICQASDSGMIIKKCWCADCAERRAENKADIAAMKVSVSRVVAEVKK